MYENDGQHQVVWYGREYGSFKSVTPPRVKHSLQSKPVSGEGDFREGNRPLGVCPILYTSNTNRIVTRKKS